MYISNIQGRECNFEKLEGLKRNLLLHYSSLAQKATKVVSARASANNLSRRKKNLEEKWCGASSPSTLFQVAFVSLFYFLVETLGMDSYS